MPELLAAGVLGRRWGVCSRNCGLRGCGAGTCAAERQGGPGAPALGQGLAPLHLLVPEYTGPYDGASLLGRAPQGARRKWPWKVHRELASSPACGQDTKQRLPCQETEVPAQPSGPDTTHQLSARPRGPAKRSCCSPVEIASVCCRFCGPAQPGTLSVGRCGPFC